MKFADILRQPDSPVRTAALAEWIQSLYSEDKPILVGGAAVELYTAGAYSTGDLDFVGQVPASVEKALAEHGFSKEGRHWIHEGGRLFVEFPGTRLEEGERTVELELEGHRVRLVSPEALIVDRLAAWQFWRSGEDAVNALLVARSVATDPDALRALAARREVAPALEQLVRALERWADVEPTSEELEAWAKKPPTG